MTATALIFDLDGTLSDPAVGIGRSLNYALEAFGFAALTAPDVSRHVGPPLEMAFRDIVPHASNDTILGLVAKFRERYLDVGYAENTVYAGIPEALRRLQDSGTVMGVCTSKRVDAAEKILQLFDLRAHFAFLSGGDVGVRKQDQLQRLIGQGVVGRRSMMIGDRGVDISAARANGLGAIGVLWGHGTRAELLAAEPDRLLEHAAELPELCSSRRTPPPARC